MSAADPFSSNITSSNSSSVAFGDSNTGDDDEFGAFAAAAPASLSPASALAAAPHAPNVSSTTTTSGTFAPPPPAPFVAAALPDIVFADDEYDNPFADIVHEAPKSGGASRTNSFSAVSTGASAISSTSTSTTSSSAPASGSAFFGAPVLQSQAQTSAVSLAFGSPLLSFSPVPTPSSSAPLAASSGVVDIFAAADASSVDVFSLSASASSVSSAPVAEAELLSFSPLHLSSSAPPSSAPPSFLLNSPPPSAVSSAAPLSDSNLMPRFSLPPPRASSTPALSPVLGSGVGIDAAKSASFAGHVSVGELLSFSPIASASATSFSDSFASSSGVGGAAASSIFGDDDLFSLSTADLTAEPMRAAPAATESTATAAAVAAADPFDEATTAATMPSLSESSRVGAVDVFASPVVAATVTDEAAETSLLSSAKSLADQNHVAGATSSVSSLETVSLAAEAEAAAATDESMSSAALDALAESAAGESVAADVASATEPTAAVASTAAAATADPVDEPGTPHETSRLSIPSPVGYSQFAFITQGFSPLTSGSNDAPSSFAGAAASSSLSEQSATSTQSQSSLSERAALDSTSAGSDTATTPTGNRADGVDYASFSSSDSSPRSSNEVPGALDAAVVVDETKRTNAGSDSGDNDTAVAWSLDSAEDSPRTTSAVEGASPLDAPSDALDEVAADGIATPWSAESTATSTDAFGAFDAAPASTAALSFPVSGDASHDDDFGSDDGFGGFAHSTTGVSDHTAVVAAAATGDDDDFGDFGQSSTAQSRATDDDDDSFGDFAQSATLADGGDDDDFGDFGQSLTVGNGDDDDDDFGDFGQSSSAAAGDDGDDFGDFGQSTSAPATFHMDASATSASSSFASVSAAPSFDVLPTTPQQQDLRSLFREAFPTPSPVLEPLEPAPQVPSTASHSFTKDLFQSNEHARSDALIATIYCAAIERYFQDASQSSESESGLTAATPLTGAEQYVSELRAVRLKHLKYVLTEKIQEAARHDGLFPHGSQQHHAMLALVNSDDEAKMRNALMGVQDALFASSVNDAMMRIARQAALSAKAKIAEQAAHQQASSRGSLLATTRQLLSRSAGAGTSGGGQDSSDAAAAAAATAAASATVNGSGSGDDSGGENSGTETSGAARNRLSSSEGELGASLTSSSSHSKGSGGLMKKFQDRFSSFSSSRGRPRLVSLRRTGQSGDEVRKMELNMDSISGGLDEVKWKCAVFLYDVDEVAQVAPSQISIRSYPGKEVLAAKSDRAALMKLLKPGAIWTVDIGASSNDVLNAW